jgi:hypothetical protein
MTEYVVLRQGAADQSETGAWSEIARATAATPKAAIKAATDGKPAAERTGTFVATPVRSWQPVTRKVEPAEREVWE